MSYKIQSYHLNELQILDHFKEMEKRFRRNTERPFFPSLNYFLNDDKDKISLLKEQIENMVYFIGLGNMPNKIKVSKLDDAAALINLAETSYIDITIDEDVLKRNDFDNIFGALAHELGHKMLKVKGLFFSTFLEFENEVYADLSTFYLGFGKFVLRGFNIVADDTKPKMGYLTPDTYVMAYVISEYLNGREPDTTALNEPIKKMIEKAASQCKTKWLKTVLNEDDLKEQYKSLSLPCGTSSTVIRVIEEILKLEETQVKNFIVPFHKHSLQEANHSPLECRKAAIAFATYQDSSDLDSFLGQKSLDKLIEIATLIILERGSDLDKLLSSIAYKCPICNTPINNPAFKTSSGQRIYHIRCKICNTQFAIDNRLPKLKERIQNQVNLFSSLKPKNIDNNLIITSIVKSLYDSKNFFSRKEQEQGLRIDSLERQNRELKAKIAKWQSMKWWQRLFYKGK